MTGSKARWKRLLAYMLAFAMVFSSAAVSSFGTATVQAASKSIKSVKVQLKVGSKDVTKKTITLGKGCKVNVDAIVRPKSAKKSPVKFASAKKSVATVNKNGIITGKKVGTAKINVTAIGKDNKKVTTYVKVKVVNVSLKLNKKNASLNVGKTTTLKATVTPKDSKVTWSTSNKSVATVTKKGVVKGVKAGTATITAKAGTKKATCKVTVKAATSSVAVTSVEASADPTEISVGGITQVVANVLPANATDKKITYSTSNEAVAVVNAETGVVTGVSAGKATITARSANGKTDSVEITVTEAIKVTAITIEPSSPVEVDINGVVELSATVEPTTASAKLVKWSSDNDAIATVDDNGKVTGVAEGTATITASATDDSGVTASCQVVVKKLGEMSMSLENPYQSAATEQPLKNTVLYGDNMHIVVQLRNGSQPAPNENVTLRLKKIGYDLNGDQRDNYEIKQDYAVTDSNGRADFVVGLKGTFNNENPMTGTAEVYSLIATRTRANDDNNVNQQELIVNTATIRSNGLKVVRDTLQPSDAATEKGWTTKGDVVKSTKALSNTAASNQEYVVNQKVSPANDADRNKVEFYVDTEIMYGQDEKEIRQDWDWLPSTTVTGESGTYSVYNTAEDTTTRTEITEIPEGIQYLTVNFKKVNLSEFTAIHVDLLNSTTKQNVAHKKITSLSNLETTELAKELSLQLDNSNNLNDKTILVVSVVTKGQVKVSEQGYILSRVKGVFATNRNNGIKSYPLSNGNVVWEEISDKVTYETNSMSVAEAQSYLGIDLTNCKVETRVPAFPYSGDAFITVKKNGTVEGIYAYPTENDGKNKNVLAPSSDKKAILVSEKEATERRVNTMTTSGNRAIVKTTETGMTALKATININGLSEDVFNSQNGKVLYTSVQWAPTSQSTDTPATVHDDYYAIEGQIVKVEAQLLDLNDNPKADRGQGIDFFAEGLKDGVDKLNGNFSMGQSIDAAEKVLLASNITATDSSGKTVLQLLANNMADIKGLYAKPSNSQYKVKLNVIGNQEPLPVSNKADIYWVDLGLSYDHSENDDQPALENYGNREVGHVSDPADSNDTVVPVYDDPSDADKNPESSFDTLTDWRIGYLPVARTTKPNTTVAIDNDSIKIDYSISSNSIDISGTKAGNYLVSKDNNVAVLHSDEIGKIRLTGKVSASNADLSNVVFTCTDTVTKKSVSKTNVGTGTSNAITNTAITHQINWNGIGMYVDFIAEKGTKFAADQVPDIFIKVRDANDKRYVSESVKYQIVANGTEQKAITKTTETKGARKGCINIKDDLKTAINNTPGTYFVNILSVRDNDQITNRIILNVDAPIAPVVPDEPTPSENSALVGDVNAGAMVSE